MWPIGPGGGWLALGSGLNGPVKAIAINGSDVYVGGAFTTAGQYQRHQHRQMERLELGRHSAAV